MAEDTMKAGDNPADYNAGPVQDFLATADRAEAQRVLEAETSEGGKGRVGVKDAAQARLDALDAEAAQDGSQEGGDGSGDRTQLGGSEDGATGSVAADKPAQVTEAATVGTVHQEGAPAALVEASEESQRVGYLGETADKPDYSQANPAVMGRRED